MQSPPPAAPPAAPKAPPPPAAPQEPKTVPSTAVRYLTRPAPVYPAYSRRVGETGRVVLRVLIDAGGSPANVTVQQSSGFKRLDDSAVTAVRAARFQPYTEDGTPRPVWVLIPIVFDLEN